MAWPNEVTAFRTETLTSKQAGLSGADWIGAYTQEGLTHTNGQVADTVMGQLVALYNRERALPDATEAQKGLVELATEAEVQAGTAGVVATGARLKAELDRRAALPSLITPTLQNGWSQAAGTLQLAYWKKDGIVHLQGSAAGGTIGTVPMFTLPVGYRPPAEAHFSVDGSGTTGPAKVRILANGEVQPWVNESNARFSLNGVYFRAA